MPAIGIGISPMLRRFRASGYGAYTTAWYTQVLVNGGTATAGELAALTTFETAVGSDMAEFDRLWIHGLANSVAARVSFVNPTSTLITAVNSPTFTAGIGYSGNGTTQSLDTNYNASTSAVKFTTNNGSYGNYVNVAATAGGPSAYMGYVKDTGGNCNCWYNPSYIAAGYASSVNTNASLTNAYAGATTALQIQFKDSAANIKSYRNSTLLFTTAQTSGIVPSIKFSILARMYFATGTPISQSNARVSLSFIGSANYNITTFSSAVTALGTTLGWAV